MNSIARLKELSAEIFDFQNITSLLAWDQEVYMPQGAVNDRSSQLSRMSGLVHGKQTSQELGDLLKKAHDELDGYFEHDRALVRVMQRAYDMSTKLPAEFVTEFTQLTSRSVHAWVDARKKSDFSLFAPFLEKVVQMTKKQTELLGYKEHPYDALLDLYEEGLTTADVERVFDEIKQPLIELLPLVEKNWTSSLAPHDPIAVEAQKEFVRELVTSIGYDFNRGRMDVAPHPFMERFGHDDRRITNRYDEKDIGGALFGSMHESGHAMYEQGIGTDIAGSALDSGVSLGMHESQSRMWENMIGRSKEFWEFSFPKLQKAFPSQFGKMTSEDFYRRINHVRASLIRTESDEVTYNLHILIRFEIEKALIEGTVAVKDLPELWNAKYKEYLGVDVPNDAQGVLQDIHWSHGSIGYFPTYTLGNLAAAQIWRKYQEVDPGYVDTLRKGEFSKIREWLRANMYQYGSVYQPKELIRRVTGEDVQSKYLVEYLRGKYLKGTTC